MKLYPFVIGRTSFFTSGACFRSVYESPSETLFGLLKSLQCHKQLHVILVDFSAPVVLGQSPHSSAHVAQTQAHEALVTFSDFGQLKPLKTAAPGIKSCVEEKVEEGMEGGGGGHYLRVSASQQHHSLLTVTLSPVVL